MRAWSFSEPRCGFALNLDDIKNGVRPLEASHVGLYPTPAPPLRGEGSFYASSGRIAGKMPAYPADASLLEIAPPRVQTLPVLNPADASLLEIALPAEWAVRSLMFF